MPAVWEWVEVAVADVVAGDKIRFQLGDDVEVATVVSVIVTQSDPQGSLGWFRYMTLEGWEPDFMWRTGARVQRWERVDAGGVS